MSGSRESILHWANQGGEIKSIGTRRVGWTIAVIVRGE
jgi:hypothetical protein